MTQDEIIEMAKQVGDVLTDNRGRMTFCFDEYGLEAFDKLVAAKEREACAEVRDLLFALAERIRTTHLYGPEVRKMLEQEEAIRARGEA